MALSDPEQLKKRYQKSFTIQENFHNLVPGGSHTYSKGEDQHPQLSPKIVTRAKGALCWDVDDNKYIDWMMGNRTFILGHAHDRVDEAVIAALRNGTNFSRPGILEYELAEYLTDLWPVAEMVKFGKNGSDVTHAAIKLARAYTGRTLIAKCGDQPFFGTDDWFIASTPCDGGIPIAEKSYTLNFTYNDIASLQALFDAHPQQIAAVILEPVKDTEPSSDYLPRLKKLCNDNGAILIFDEMIAGIRFNLRGAHHRWGVYPDLACFGKCISNGYSCSVLAGKREIMELGGIFHDRPRTFLLSQTHASETVGLAATMATLKECESIDATSYVWSYGKSFKDNANKIAKNHGLDKHISVKGFDCNPYFSFLGADGKTSVPLMTLFIQECLARGIMLSWLTITTAHNEKHMEKTMNVFDEVLADLRPVIINNEIEKFLYGPAIRPVMRTYNRCMQRQCGRLHSDAAQSACCHKD